LLDLVANAVRYFPHRAAQRDSRDAFWADLRESVRGRRSVGRGNDIDAFNAVRVQNDADGLGQKIDTKLWRQSVRAPLGQEDPRV
jgi:hypothetical protein